MMTEPFRNLKRAAFVAILSVSVGVRAADVCEIVSADGETITGYASITDAANALNASGERGSTLKMIADVDITTTLTTTAAKNGTFVLLTNPEMTFDLNGHTLTAGHTSYTYPALKFGNGANVTITDSSVAGTGKVISKCCGIYIMTAGTRVTLEKGAFLFSSTSTGLYGANVANGEFVMNGGSIIGTSSKKSYGIYTSAGSATVNGGSITMTGTATSTSYINYALYVYGTGAMKVTGGTIEAKNASSCYAIYQAGATKGTVTITGGTIIATGTGTGATANSVVAYGYNFQISGGDFLSRRTAGTAAGYAIYSMGGSALRGGYFVTTQGSADIYGTGLVKGGSFVHTPGDTTYATGYMHADISPAEEHEIAGTSYSFAHTAAQDPSLPDVAETTGGVKHKSFDDAFFAVPEGGTVKLLADWNLGHTSGSCSINIDKTMTLDLNGHTVEGGSGSGSELFKASAGTFTLTDTSAGGAGQALGMEYFARFAGSSHFVLAGGTCGTASGRKVQYGIYLSDSASFTMDGGRLDFVGNAPYAVYPNSKGGAVTINDGEIVCVGTNTYAVGINQYGEGYSPVTVNGGKIVVVATRQVSNAYAIGVQGSDFTINGGTICVRGITESYESYAVKGDGLAGCVINGGNFGSTGGTDLSHDVTGCLVKGGSFEHGAAAATPYETVATTGTADLPASPYLAEATFALTQKVQLAPGVTPCVRLSNGQTYQTIFDAVANLAMTDTVTVLRDFSMGSVRLFLPDGHATTLDLNGHVIDATGIAGKYGSSSAMGAISLHSGSLTVADTSVGGNGRLNASEVGIILQKNGTADLLITGGAISAYSANGAAAAVNREDGASGVVRMTGGSVLCDAYTTAYGFYCYNAAAVYQIEGGAIYLKKRQDSDSMSYAKLVNNSTTEITGGKFTMETPACDGGYFGTGIKVKGGTYSFDPAPYVPLSDLGVFADGTEKVTPFADELTLAYRVAVDPDPLPRIRNMTTEVDYLDPLEAIAEVNAGETLQVLRDFDVGLTPIEITKGCTLDLNGHVLSSQFATSVLNVTGATDGNPLTITDSARALGVRTGGIRALVSTAVAVNFASSSSGWNVTFDDVVLYSARINALRDQSTSTTRNNITVRNAVVTVENTGVTENVYFSAIRSEKGHTKLTVLDSEVTVAISNCLGRSEGPIALFNLGTANAGGACVISGGVYRVVGPNIDYGYILAKTHASKVVTVADGYFSVEPSASASGVAFYAEEQRRSITVSGGCYSDNVKPTTWITPLTTTIVAVTDVPGYDWRVLPNDEGNAASVGGVEYATLEAAVAAVASGEASGTITLLKYVVCNGTLVITPGVTIDGNGNKITLNGNPAMLVAPGATVPDCLYQMPAASLVTPVGATNVYYTTLARALSAAKTTQVVKLERDLEETIVTTTRIIDLNGHDVTYKTKDYVGLVRFSKGQAGSSYTITLTNSSETVSTVENTADYGYGATVAKYATGLSVGDGTKHLVVCERVKLKANLAVFITDEDCSLDLSGTAEGVNHNSAAGASVMGNGTLVYRGTDIRVREGAEVIGYAGSYHPQDGFLEIEGGTWRGSFSALYVKSGDILVWGGSFTGYGAKHPFEHDDSGYYATGDGVVFESCDYPGGDPTAHVFGGVFASSNNQPIAVYQYGAGVAISNFVWGAVLNKEPDSGLVASAFAASEISVAGKPWWIVGSNVTVTAGAVTHGYFTFDPTVYADPGALVTTLDGVADGIGLTLWKVASQGSATTDEQGNPVAVDTFEEAAEVAPEGGVIVVWNETVDVAVDKPQIIVPTGSADLSQIVPADESGLSRTNSADIVLIGTNVNHIVVVEQNAGVEPQPTEVPEETDPTAWAAVSNMADHVTAKSPLAIVHRQVLEEITASTPAMEVDALISSLKIEVTPTGVETGEQTSAEAPLRITKAVFDLTPVLTVSKMKDGVETTLYAMTNDFALSGAATLITIPCGSILPVAVLHDHGGDITVLLPGTGPLPDDATFVYDPVGKAVTLAMSEFSTVTILGDESFLTFDIAYDAQDGRWANGQTVSNVATLVSDGYVLPAEDPIREEYVFKGWYASWTNGAAKVENGTPLTQLANHTIYAKWESELMPEGGGEAVMQGKDIDGAATMVLGAKTNEQGEVVVEAQIAGGAFVIPERIGNDVNSKFVAAIAAEAYAKPNYDDKVPDDKKLTSVYLPGYLTRVGDAAFYACVNMTNIVFASAKDYKTNEKATLQIGSRAFASTAIETITFPVGTKTRLAAGAFANCPNLKEIFIYGDLECVKKGPFADAGDGTTPITVHLSPTYAADAAFVSMLTNSMNTSQVKIDSEPLGQASIESFEVPMESDIVIEFSVLFDSPWGVVNEKTVTLFYTDDLAEGFVGTGKTLYPTEPITQDPSTGWYKAKFHKEGGPSWDSQFYRLTIGTERK